MDKPHKHTDFFVNHISKTLNHFNDKEVNEIQLFIIGLLQRLKHTSTQLKITFRNIVTIPELEFSAGISVRALLFDTLIALNLYKILAEAENAGTSQKEIEEIAKKYCIQMLADGLTTTINYAELSKNVGFIDEAKLKVSYNNFAISYKDYLEDHLGDGSKPKVKFKKAPKTTELFIQLAMTTELKEISKIYDAYVFYSKYDHFGILYFDILKISLEDRFIHLKKSIRILVGHQVNLFSILNKFSNGDKFVEEQYKISENYLTQIMKSSS